MNRLLRFGKTLPLPSTAEIKHEIRLMEAADALDQAASGEDMDQIVRDVAAKIGLSPDRVQMLVDRFASRAAAAAG